MESTTSAIGFEDLLIINSGSGLTQGMINDSQIAKQAQARIALITIHPHSILGELVYVVVTLPGFFLSGTRCSAKDIYST